MCLCVGLLLQDVVASSDLETTFDMIGGLGDLKEEIMDIVSCPVDRGPGLYNETPRV